MSLYEMTAEAFLEIKPTTFIAEGVKERFDLQRLLRSNVGLLAADLLIISEEFSNWDDSTRSIDLLAVDREANLVVIELKRTEDGGHADLQSIRYAAMISNMTFDQAVGALASYRSVDENSARAELLSFLRWSEPNEDGFAQDVRVILVGQDFSKELTTSALWLRDREIDIRCVCLRPYRDGSRVLVHVQQIIPLPEASEYQIGVAEKRRTERAQRKQQRDYTKYEIVVNGKIERPLSKRAAALAVVKAVCDLGTSPIELQNTWGGKRLFVTAAGRHDGSSFPVAAAKRCEDDGYAWYPGDWFINTEDLFYFNGITYALSNQWGGNMVSVLKPIIDLAEGRVSLHALT